MDKPVIIIPARFDSSRFPGKPLAKILGRELILHVAHNCQIAVGKENVYIATDSKKIAEICYQNNYKYLMTDPDCPTGTDRVAMATKQLKFKPTDIIVSIQGDEPLIDPGDIIHIIDTMLKNEAGEILNGYTCCSTKESESLNVVKIVKSITNELLYASRSKIPNGSFHPLSISMYKQVCIYAFRKYHLDGFLSVIKSPLEQQEDIEILRFIELDNKVKMIKTHSINHAVDVPEDIKIVEFLIKQKDYVL